MSKITQLLTGATFAFGLLLGASAAHAADRPCKEDAMKFCKDQKPGGGGFIHCLKEHEADLSAACKEHLASVKEKVEEHRKDCEEDAAKFCKDQKPGGGRIAVCLKEHEAELSAACKAAIAKMKPAK